MKKSLLILLAIFNSVALLAQEEKNYSVGFRVNISEIEPEFQNNKIRVAILTDFLRTVQSDSTIHITRAHFGGAASPEGNDTWNRTLARRRLAAIENVVRNKIDITDEIISRDPSHISWPYLRDRVSESNLPYKQEVINIIDQAPRLVTYGAGKKIDHRVVKLQKLHDGKVWRELFDLYFADMRYSYVEFDYYKSLPYSPLLGTEPRRIYNNQAELLDIDIPKIDIWTPHLYIKSNLLGIGLLNANAAVEIDIARHWSVNIPIYYSACDYFDSTRKYRTLATQPELRFWFSKRNDRWFIGAHAGLAYYNVAFGGDYRYQDHNGTTPAIGGGLNIGYRFPLGKESRWKVELAAGAGVYPTHYDIFHNTPDVKDGLMVGSKRGVYMGIDQVSLSITYMFDLNR